MSDNERATDFRYVYANGIKMQFNGVEVILTFGIKEDPTTGDDAIREEVAVVMTPITAKILTLTLSRTIEHFESTTGSTIPVDPAKTAHLEKILEAGDAAAKASATASPQPS